MSSPESRLGLHGVATSDPATEYRTAINNHRDTLKQAVLYDQGPLASRPTSTASTPGIAGRFYRALDDTTGGPSGTLYVDYGTGWFIVWEGSVQPTRTVTGSVSGATGNVLTGTGFASERTGSGTYVITFDDNFPATPAIAPTVYADAAGLLAVQSASAAGFTLRARNLSGELNDITFGFTASDAG